MASTIRFQSYIKDKENLIVVKFEGYYLVYNTRTDKLYNVDRINGKITCDCPDYKSQTDETAICKHIIAVKMEAQQMAKEERQLNIPHNEWTKRYFGWRLAPAIERLEQIINHLRYKTNPIGLAYYEGKLHGLKLAMLTLRKA